MQDSCDDVVFRLAIGPPATTDIVVPPLHLNIGKLIPQIGMCHKPTLLELPTTSHSDNLPLGVSLLWL